MTTSIVEDEYEQPDLPMQLEDIDVYDGLSEDVLKKMDQALLADCVLYNRKVARVVGTVFMSPQFKGYDIPLLCFAQRIVELVAQGKLLADGDLSFIRFSEIRLPSASAAEG
jgi:hypothetical protein